MSKLHLLIHQEAPSYKMKAESSINYYSNILTLNYIPINPSNYSLIILLIESHGPDTADIWRGLRGHVVGSAGSRQPRVMSSAFIYAIIRYFMCIDRIVIRRDSNRQWDQ